MSTKQCPRCSRIYPDEALYCSADGVYLNEVTAPCIQSPYDRTYGEWHVTTEGDGQSSTVRDLGTHTGYIDTIAKHLALSCCYVLRFQICNPHEYWDSNPKVKAVHVSLDVKSGTWNYTSDDRAKAAKEIFKRDNRPVTITRSAHYASFTINYPDDE